LWRRLQASGSGRLPLVRARAQPGGTCTGHTQSRRGCETYNESARRALKSRRGMPHARPLLATMGSGPGRRRLHAHGHSHQLRVTPPPSTAPATALAASSSAKPPGRPACAAHCSDARVPCTCPHGGSAGERAPGSALASARLPAVAGYAACRIRATALQAASQPSHCRLGMGSHISGTLMGTSRRRSTHRLHG
jgi:hypothetical protein